MTDDHNYEVGYKKTPKEHRWPKNQSGNPSGRRPGCKNLRTLVMAALEKKIVVKENGRSRTITKREAWAKQLVNRALSADPRASAQLRDVIGNEADDGQVTFIIEKVIR